MSEVRDNQRETLASQAEQVQSTCPELYAFLADQEREMRQALARLPHPADPENWASPSAVEHVIAQLRAVAAGIGDILAGTPVRDSGAASLNRREWITGGSTR